MTTETNQDESSQPPFQFGDVVRHQSGDVIKVEACKRVVAHSHLRWAVYDANGNRFWARNCGLVERPKAESDNFVGVSALTGAAVHSTQLKTDVEKLLVASIAATLARVVKFYNGDNVGLRDEFRSVLLKELAEHRSPEVAELKTELETLAKQRDEAREELKEATAEFVRALSAAHRERDEAIASANKFGNDAIGWREVVAKCERLLKMNGPTPNDPATSAVPLQLEHRLRSLALAEKRIDDAARILDGGKISVSVNQ